MKKSRKPAPAKPAADAADAARLLPADAKEVSLDDALALAVRLQREARLDGAITLYKRILQAAPDHPDALCLLGVAEHQAGRSEHGLKLIRRAVALVPTFAGFQINLGNVLSELHRLPEALAAYGRTLELAPESADLHNNIGSLYRAMQRPDDARASYERAISLDAKHTRSWNNLGTLLDAQGDLQGAVRAHLNALEVSGQNSSSVKLLGVVLYKAGEVAKATEVFRQWMEREPDNPVAAHLHAACSGQEAPARAPDHYVEAEFDQFAASFESVLNERLHYRAPQLCVDLLGQQLGPAKADLDMLDAGCGTGLCGPLMAPWARHLVGVDLSAGMLAKAQAKGVYHELVKAELTANLRDAPQRWDAIVCADTLCYFGDLSEYMQAAASSLRAGGTMVYTVEATDDDEQDRASFLPSGRYAHGRKHLDAVAARAGLTGLHARREVLRTEGGAPVDGWLIAVQRPA
jgi:predicted TPR repeat methyltransferase